MTTQDDIETIAEYIGFDIATFNRFIEAAKMCGYSLVRDGNRLVAPPCADLETVREGLEEIRTMVQYINSQTVFATMTENSDGPKAIMPLPQEAWDILLAVGKKSHEALAALGRIRGE